MVPKAIGSTPIFYLFQIFKKKQKYLKKHQKDTLALSVCGRIKTKLFNEHENVLRI